MSKLTLRFVAYSGIFTLGIVVIYNLTHDINIAFIGSWIGTVVITIIVEALAIWSE